MANLEFVQVENIARIGGEKNFTDVMIGHYVNEKGTSYANKIYCFDKFIGKEGNECVKKVYGISAELLEILKDVEL